jgi:hypothetical protein
MPAVAGGSSGSGSGLEGPEPSRDPLTQLGVFGYLLGGHYHPRAHWVFAAGRKPRHPAQRQGARVFVSGRLDDKAVLPDDQERVPAAQKSAPSEHILLTRTALADGLQQVCHTLRETLVKSHQRLLSLVVASLRTIRLMHPRLEEILAYLSNVRADLANIVETTPPAAFVHRPDQRTWNGAQILHHVGHVEGAATKLLEGLFAKALADGLPADAETDSVVHSLDQFHVLDRLGRRIEAPDRLQPPDTAELATSWESLQRVRDRTHRAVGTVDGRDLTRIIAPHPVFGPINGYQWVLFIGQHEERHLGQLRDALHTAPHRHGYRRPPPT